MLVRSIFKNIYYRLEPFLRYLQRLSFLIGVAYFFSSVPLFASGGLVTYQDYHTVLERFGGKESPPDSSELRRVSLIALGEAFRYYGIGPAGFSEKEWKDPSAFSRKFLERWKSLLSEMHASDQLEEWVLRRDKNFLINHQLETLDGIKTALNRGVIVLPSIEHQKDFTSSLGWIESLFVGIVPADVSKASDKDYAKRIDHPMRATFLASKMDLVRHDVLHALEVSSVFNEQFSLKYLPQRLSFTSLMRSTHEHFKGKAQACRSLYYLLHEDPKAPLFLQRIGSGSSEGSRFDSIAFTEFALENTLKCFPNAIASFMGSDADRKKVCDYVNQATDPNFIDEKVHLLFGNLISYLELEKSLSETLGEYESSFARPVGRHIAFGLLRKMSQICAADSSGWESAKIKDPDSGALILAQNFKSLKSSRGSFSESFSQEMRELRNSLDEVTSYIKSDSKYERVSRTENDLLNGLLNSKQFDEVLNFLDSYPDRDWMKGLLAGGYEGTSFHEGLKLRYYLSATIDEIKEYFSDPSHQNEEKLLLCLLKNSEALATPSDRSEIADLFLSSHSKSWKKALEAIILLSVSDPDTYSALAPVFYHDAEGVRRSELKLLIEKMSSLRSAQDLYHWLHFREEQWKDEINQLKRKFPESSIPPVFRGSEFSIFGNEFFF